MIARIHNIGNRWAADPEELAFLREFPSIPEELLVRFEKEYPPKCWNPGDVPDWQHHRYSGIVDFIAWLRSIQAARLNQDVGLDPDARHVTQEGGA
jgi:hypothetical protein